jgi:hypothetical protein
MSYDNQEHINDCINNILIQELIDTFKNITNNTYIQSFWDCMDFYNPNMYYDDFMRDYPILKKFNNEDLTDINILEYYKMDYTMDYKTFLNMCKCVKQDYDNYDNGEMFADMFDMNTDTERRIINAYAYSYITEQVLYYDNLDNKTIIKIFRNIFKIKANKKKHSGLINLYEKLDKLNKKKIIINKILNDKFDTDILQNIIEFYK